MSAERVQIAVVGAGLAGLTAAYRLSSAGFAPVVFEANSERVGGRCWTAREFSGSQYGEHGGERIDSRHREIIALAGELGVALDDYYDEESDDGSYTSRIVGELVTSEQLAKDRSMIRSILHADLERRGIPLRQLTFENGVSDAALELDRMSLREWVLENVPGGASSRAGAHLLSMFSSLEGHEANEISAYLLLQEHEVMFDRFIGDGDPGDVDHLADDRYRVHGGNDRLVEALRNTLPADAVRLGARLTGIEKIDDGCRLVINGDETVEADAVVLALPFPALRRANHDRAGFSELKRAAIQEFGMGACSKLTMQFDCAVTDLENWTDFLSNDQPRFVLYESTPRNRDTSCLLTAYFGGSVAANLPAAVAHGPAPEHLVNEVLDIVAPALPTLRAAYSGVAWLDAWADDENAGGAYSMFKPGQFTRFWSVPSEPEGSIFFAGEHTSKTSRSYLCGAVESGNRVSQEVVAHLKAAQTSAPA